MRGIITTIPLIFSLYFIITTNEVQTKITAKILHYTPEHQLNNDRIPQHRRKDHLRQSMGIIALASKS